MLGQGSGQGLDIESLQPARWQHLDAGAGHQGSHLPGLQQGQVPAALPNPLPAEKRRQRSKTDPALPVLRPGTQLVDARRIRGLHGQSG